MTKQEEQIIIAKVIAGVTNAFTMIVNRYKDMAVLIAYNILLNQEDAEEVAQDAFVKAYAALQSYKADARFSTWLYRIVVNTALNKRKLKKYHSNEITKEKIVDTGINSIETLQVASEYRKHIQQALECLPVKERLCITLFYLNELAVDEIQQMTGLSVSNIKILLYRGRKNMYAALHNYLKDEVFNLIHR